MLVQSTREHRKQLKANKDTKQYGTHYPTQRPGNINVEENLSMESEATKYTEPRCERDNQVTRTKVMEDSALPLNHETLQRHTVRNKPVAAPLSTQHTAYPQHLGHTEHCADPGCAARCLLVPQWSMVVKSLQESSRYCCTIMRYLNIKLFPI